MPRNRKPSSNGKHKPGSNGTALATVEPAALPTISRSEANRKLKERAQEIYHDARAQREERIRQFEAEYGRADRIDHTLLRDLQHLQSVSPRSPRASSSTATRANPRSRSSRNSSATSSANSARISPPSAHWSCSRRSRSATTSAWAARSGARASTNRFSPATT
jgi:hypothetical protein